MPVVFSREQASLSNDQQATEQVIARMSEHIRAAHGDPAVVRVAADCLHLAGGGHLNPLQRGKAVWYWVKTHVQFVQDDDLIERLFGEHGQRELLISPILLLRQAHPKGDCDDFTMAACALCWELGLSCRIVTIKGDPRDPSRWSHVYAATPDLVMDCSHGRRPGWEVPYWFERAEWDPETGAFLGSAGPRTPTRFIPDNGDYQAEKFTIPGLRGCWA